MPNDSTQKLIDKTAKYLVKMIESIIVFESGRIVGEVERTNKTEGITSCLTNMLTEFSQTLSETQAALERDRTKVAEFVKQVKHTLNGYDWLISGRGSYEWDDDKWHEEFRRASEAIRKDLEVLEKIAADWKYCQRIQDAIVAARKPRPNLADLIRINCPDWDEMLLSDKQLMVAGAAAAFGGLNEWMEKNE